jgi:hypothetical protein
MNFHTGFTLEQAHSSRRCCFSNKNPMLLSSSCRVEEKNQSPTDDRSDVAVPGPSCSRSALSPSQGPCSPESSSTKRSIDQSELALDKFLPQLSENIVDKGTSNAKAAYCTAHQKSTQPALICSIKAPQSTETSKSPKLKDLELELRASCAHALSLCAFQDDLEMEMNW